MRCTLSGRQAIARVTHQESESSCVVSILRQTKGKVDTGGGAVPAPLILYNLHKAVQKLCDALLKRTSGGGVGWDDRGGNQGLFSSLSSLLASRVSSFVDAVL